MGQLVCQGFILGMLALAFFMNVYWDINGRPAKPTKGFRGLVETLIITAVLAAVYYNAGAFSLIVGR